MKRIFLLLPVFATLLSNSSCVLAAETTPAVPQRDPFKAQIVAYFRLPGGMALNPQQRQAYDAFCKSIEPDLRDALAQMRESRKEPVAYAAASQQFRDLRARIQACREQLTSASMAPNLLVPVSQRRAADSILARNHIARFSVDSAVDDEEDGYPIMIVPMPWPMVVPPPYGPGFPPHEPPPVPLPGHGHPHSHGSGNLSPSHDLHRSSGDHGSNSARDDHKRK